ncbi:MAG: transcription elongation factor GreA [Thermotogae bacterium]|nr:transcription elongation factor GreA [Thermotogota bacterium]RKX44067.1 MAG: transcription elongation factor GreA [Thermotogota bacterium]
MARERIRLTRDGYETLKKEYEELRRKLLYDVAQRIKEARELGDLSENSEYDEAKNEQGRIGSRVKELEMILENAELIDNEAAGNNVALGSKILLKNLSTGEEKEIRLVSPAEADIFKGKVSVESPIGKAILGKSAGETVRVRTPKGVQTYLLVKVNQ